MITSQWKSHNILFSISMSHSLRPPHHSFLVRNMLQENYTLVVWSAPLHVYFQPAGVLLLIGLVRTEPHTDDFRSSQSGGFMAHPCPLKKQV